MLRNKQPYSLTPLYFVKSCAKFEQKIGIVWQIKTLAVISYFNTEFVSLLLNYNVNNITLFIKTIFNRIGNQIMKDTIKENR